MQKASSEELDEQPQEKIEEIEKKVYYNEEEIPDNGGEIKLN